MKKLFSFLIFISFLIVSCGPTTEEIATQIAISIAETADSWTPTPAHTPTIAPTSTATPPPPPPFYIGDCVFEEDCPEANLFTYYLDSDPDYNTLTRIVFPFDDMVRFNNAWCTRNETILSENEEHITYIFEIDGISYLDYATITLGYWWYDNSDDASPCTFIGATLSDFQAGQSHQITLGFSTDTEVNDGWDDYPPFTYVYEFELVPVLLPTPSPTPAKSFSASLNGSAASLFHGPGTVYDTDYYISSNDKLEIIGAAYDCSWIKVKTTTGSKRGWVYYTYLDYNLDCSDIPTVSFPAEPTALPAVYVPPPGSIDLLIENNTGASVTLYMNGPINNTFYISSGNQTITLPGGTYSYSLYGCGDSLSGEYSFGSGDVWTWWCE